MKKYATFIICMGGFLILVFIRDTLFGANKNQSPTIPNSSNNLNPQTATGKYKNGAYTGTVEDAYYGLIQAKATITNGNLSDIQLLKYPNDNNTSRSINENALVLWKSEAIQKQNANVDIVTGATQSSEAFQKSLSNALKQAS